MKSTAALLAALLSLALPAAAQDEADKVRRLGQDSVNPHRVSYKKLTR